MPLEDRIRLLASLFSIDARDYAVVSNCVHTVLKLRPDEAAFSSERDVAERWACLFKGPLLFKDYLEGYLELVDTTGRVLRDDKRGAIPIHLPAILQRLGLNHSRWLQQCTEFEALYHKRFRRRPAQAA